MPLMWNQVTPSLTCLQTTKEDHREDGKKSSLGQYFQVENSFQGMNSDDKARLVFSHFETNLFLALESCSLHTVK